MNLIKNYRPNGLEVTLDDDSVVKLMVVRNNPRFGIIAMIQDRGRLVLWDKDNVGSHASDSEAEFVAQLKAVL